MGVRVPLTPENIKELKDDPKLRDKLEFYVQPVKKRIFQDDEYIKVNKERIDWWVSIPFM